MNRSKQLRRLGWGALLLLIIALILVIFFIHESTANRMNAALDELSTVSIDERWSHPQMAKIRALGSKAVPDLRRVLRERNSRPTRIVLRLQNKLPRATTKFLHLDPRRVNERRLAACQAIEVLGPAGRAAAPDIIDFIADQSIDIGDLNSAARALSKIGIDAEVADRLNAVMETKGTKLHWAVRTYLIRMLAVAKPPSARTFKTFVRARSDPNIPIQQEAARLVGQLTENSTMKSSEIDELIRDEDIGIRVYGAKMRWRQNHQSAAVVPILIDALDHVETMPIALKLLAEVGPEASETIPALEKLTSDPDLEIAALAVAALKQIRNK
jgi:hypothetical protein